MVFSLRYAFLHSRYTAHLCDLEMEESRAYATWDMFDFVNSNSCLYNNEWESSRNGCNYSTVSSYNNQISLI